VPSVLSAVRNRAVSDEALADDRKCKCLIRAAVYEDKLCNFDSSFQDFPDRRIVVK